MATADEILRLYRITDPEMYEASRTKRSFFLKTKLNWWLLIPILPTRS